MPEVEEAPAVEIPPSEKVAINRMADKFKAAMAAQTPAKPAAIAPAEPPQPAPSPASPPEKPAPARAPAPAPNPPQPAAPEKPTLPPEVKGNARQAFEKLESIKDKYQKDFETLKPQVDSLAAEKAALAAERDQLKAQLDEAKKGSVEYEQLKQQHADADKIIKQFYIEHDPHFQSHYGQRMQTAKTEAEQWAGAENAEKVKGILEMPPSKFRDDQMATIREGMDDFRGTALVNAYVELQRIERERAAELAKPIENHRKLQEVRQREAQEQAAQYAAKATAVVTDINGKLADDLKDFPEAEPIRAAIKKMVFGEVGTDEYVLFLTDAARWRRYQKTLTEQKELIAKLQTQIGEMTAAQPGVQSGAAPAERKPPPRDNSDLGDKFRRARDGK